MSRRGMGQSLGDYLSDNVLYFLQGIQMEEQSVEMVEHRRCGEWEYEN